MILTILTLGTGHVLGHSLESDDLLVLVEEAGFERSIRHEDDPSESQHHREQT